EVLHSFLYTSLLSSVEKVNFVFLSPFVVTSVERCHCASVKTKSIADGVMQILQSIRVQNGNVSENIFFCIEYHSEFINHKNKILMAKLRQIRCTDNIILIVFRPKKAISLNCYSCFFNSSLMMVSK